MTEVSRGAASAVTRRAAPFYFHHSLVALLVLLVFLARPSWGAGVPILCYHAIQPSPRSDYSVSIESFTRQMRYLADQGYRVITVKELVEAMRQKKLPVKSVVISIDDGDPSVYTTAWPIMKKLKFPCSIYIYTSRVGSPHGLTQTQVREMADAGVEIGGHTRTHAYLTPPKKSRSWKALTLVQQTDEVVGSKKTLESMVGQPVEFLAYPYGLYNDQVEQLALSAGYQAMLTLDWGNNTEKTLPARLKRKQVMRDMTLPQFAKLLK